MRAVRTLALTAGYTGRGGVLDAPCSPLALAWAEAHWARPVTAEQSLATIARLDAEHARDTVLAAWLDRGGMNAPHRGPACPTMPRYAR